MTLCLVSLRQGVSGSFGATIWVTSPAAVGRQATDSPLDTGRSTSCWWRYSISTAGV